LICIPLILAYKFKTNQILGDMKQTTALNNLERGQCLTEAQLKELNIVPTDIDCFQFSHFVLYANKDKRIILQPLPHNQYKIIRVYDYVESTSNVYID
jgi:hypothetical protein